MKSIMKSAVNMATRCTSCGTVFRVVPDQLRVSEGWVRCGRCSEVFNAAEHMVDGSDVESAASPSTAKALFDTETDASEQVDASARVADLFVAAEVAAPAPARPRPRGPEAAPLAPSTSPTFMKQAERAARWQQPRIKSALWAAVVAALLALAAQVAVEYRELVAARWPASRALVEALCACSVGAPRLIEALAVDSSGLVRVEGSSQYRLSVVLRNRAAMALALPAIDLTLTDTQGRVIARRALAARELGAASTTIAGASELPLQATLAIPERPVSGYTIEVFYP